MRRAGRPALPADGRRRSPRCRGALRRAALRIACRTRAADDPAMDDLADQGELDHAQQHGDKDIDHDVAPSILVFVVE